MDDEWVSRCNQWEKCHSYRTRSEFQRLAASTYHVSRLVTASLLASLETGGRARSCSFNQAHLAGLGGHIIGVTDRGFPRRAVPVLKLYRRETQTPPRHFPKLNFNSKMSNFTMQINAYQESTKANIEVNERVSKNLGTIEILGTVHFNLVPMSA